MSATLCTCIRDEKLERVLPDPECPAPGHFYDQIQELNRLDP